MEFTQSNDNIVLIATETFEDIKLVVRGDRFERSIRTFFYKNEKLLDNYPYWLRKEANIFLEKYLFKQLDQYAIIGICKDISKLLPKLYEDLQREVCIYDGNSDFEDRIN